MVHSLRPLRDNLRRHPIARFLVNRSPWSRFMHAYELVQLAVIVAVHGRLVARTRAKFPDAALEVYWTASKCRQDHWARTLKALAADASQLASPAERAMRAQTGQVLDEILVSEVLSRVWLAVCCAADRLRCHQDAGPIANSVLAGHLEARHRVLSLMVYGYGLGVEEAVALNRRRLRNERWTDMLLSFVVDPDDLATCAFEPRRVAEWSQSARDSNLRRRDGLATVAALAKLVAAEHKVATSPAPNGDLNRRIASSILACFPPSMFDSVGSPSSIQQLALLQGTPDSQGRLNLNTDQSPRNRIRNTDVGNRGYRGGQSDLW